MKVPKFKNLKEERKFWDSHDSTEYLDDFEVAKELVELLKYGAGKFSRFFRAASVTLI